MCTVNLCRMKSYNRPIYKIVSTNKKTFNSWFNSYKWIKGKNHIAHGSDITKTLKKTPKEIGWGIFHNFTNLKDIKKFIITEHYENSKSMVVLKLKAGGIIFKGTAKIGSDVDGCINVCCTEAFWGGHYYKLEKKKFKRY